MKDLLKMKGNIATDITSIQNLIKECQAKGQYTGIAALTLKLEAKQDIKKLIDIIYPML